MYNIHYDFLHIEKTTFFFSQMATKTRIALNV